MIPGTCFAAFILGAGLDIDEVLPLVLPQEALAYLLYLGT